jgi:phosphoenolpyruvate carboxylase
MRDIPVCMATQHPDSASRYVSVQEEVDEAVNCLRRSEGGLGFDEFMIDYMGKLTPYHQIAQILRKLAKETDLVPSRDVFITPRMVSDFYEEPFRQLMTLLAVIEGIQFSLRHFGQQGIIEIVQAMTETVEELVRCYHRANNFFKSVRKEVKMLDEGEIRIIPLFEGIPEHLSLPSVLPAYIRQVGVTDYLRVFIGKSETAVISGHPASVLSCKIALSDCGMVQEETDVKIYPILGGGALPFRGHLTLENFDSFIKEYAGVWTFTIQSAMRYDHGSEETRILLQKLREQTRKVPLSYSEEDRREILHSIAIFSKNYLLELLEIADWLAKISQYVPDRRDRILGQQDVAYYRGLRNVRELAEVCFDKATRREVLALDVDKFALLPRPIKLVAALYSCGLPPEMIGTGNALAEIEKKQGEKWVSRLLGEVFPSLAIDISWASRFLSESFLITPRIQKGIDLLKETFRFDEPEGRHAILSRMAVAYIAGDESLRATIPKKFAIQISPGEISEYFGGSTQENLSKLILDMGRIRGALG